MLFRNSFRDALYARGVIIDWRYSFYNHQRGHKAADGLSAVSTTRLGRTVKGRKLRLDHSKITVHNQSPTAVMA